MNPPPHKTAYVYLLKSLQTDKFYLGWTTDLKRRVAEHNSGKSYYTKFRGPWKLVYYEIYKNVNDAKKRERTLKHNPRMLFLFKKRALNKQEVVDDPTTSSQEVVG